MYATTAQDLGLEADTQVKLGGRASLKVGPYRRQRSLVSKVIALIKNKSETTAIEYCLVAAGISLAIIATGICDWF